MTIQQRYGLGAAVMIGAVLVVSCATLGAQPAGPASVPATAIAIPATPTSVPATAASAGEPQGATLNLDEIFPPGEGKDLVMNNCGTCHSWVCAIKWQRSAEHWATAKAAHLDKTAALREEQLDALWAYLAENFNDTKPEPILPPAFRDLGCARGI